MPKSPDHYRQKKQAADAEVAAKLQPIVDRLVAKIEAAMDAHYEGVGAFVYHTDLADVEDTTVTKECWSLALSCFKDIRWEVAVEAVYRPGIPMRIRFEPQRNVEREILNPRPIPKRVPMHYLPPLQEMTPDVQIPPGRRMSPVDPWCGSIRHSEDDGK